MKNYVRKYRKAAKLTLAQLAELSGVPVSTLSDIERGAEPRLTTALLLARALGKTVEELWKLEGGSPHNSGLPE